MHSVRLGTNKVSLLSIFLFILDSFAEICFYLTVLKLKTFSFFSHRKRVNGNKFLNIALRVRSINVTVE